MSERKKTKVQNIFKLSIVNYLSYLGFAQSTLVRENSNKIWFSSHLIVPLTNVEGRRHLGNKNKNLFCISLDLHYLCSQK